MLTKKTHNIVENAVKAIAYDLFVFMINPKHRGPNFTWDHSFGKMIQNQIEIHLSLSIPKHQLKEALSLAKSLSLSIVNHILEESGVVKLAL